MTFETFEKASQLKLNLEKYTQIIAELYNNPSEGVVIAFGDLSTSGDPIAKEIRDKLRSYYEQLHGNTLVELQSL